MGIKLARVPALLLLAIVPFIMGTVTPPQENTAGPVQETQFRVCSDPNNLPFSNKRQEGFENKIADLIAKDWGQTVTYTWWPQRRGFVRNTLRAKLCDVVIGVPKGYDPVATTQPYYRSTYVFIYPADKGWDIKALSDPILKKLRLGVNVIGDDYANPPPVMAMSKYGLVGPQGYSIYGDYSQDSPPREIIDALGKGEIDVAIVWGPLAYFTKQQPIPLKVVPLPPSEEADLPFQYDISMGVRRGDKELKARLEETLQRKSSEIQAILKEYDVPLMPMTVAGDK